MYNDAEFPASDSKLANPSRFLPWQDEARCAETDPEAFFPERSAGNANPKKVCAKCDVGLECLTDALEKDVKYGVRGGMLASERKKLVKASRAEVAEAYKKAKKRNEKL